MDLEETTTLHRVTTTTVVTATDEETTTLHRVKTATVEMDSEEETKTTTASKSTAKTVSSSSKKAVVNRGRSTTKSSGVSDDDSDSGTSTSNTTQTKKTRGYERWGEGGRPHLAPARGTDTKKTAASRGRSNGSRVNKTTKQGGVRVPSSAESLPRHRARNETKTTTARKSASKAVSPKRSKKAVVTRGRSTTNSSGVSDSSLSDDSDSGTSTSNTTQTKKTRGYERWGESGRPHLAPARGTDTKKTATSRGRSNGSRVNKTTKQGGVRVPSSAESLPRHRARNETKTTTARKSASKAVSSKRSKKAVVTRGRSTTNSSGVSDTSLSDDSNSGTSTSNTTQTKKTRGYERWGEANRPASKSQAKKSNEESFDSEPSTPSGKESVRTDGSASQ